MARGRVVSGEVQVCCERDLFFRNDLGICSA